MGKIPAYYYDVFPISRTKFLFATSVTLWESRSEVLPFVSRNSLLERTLECSGTHIFPTYLLLSSSHFEIRKTNNKVLSWIQIIIRESNTEEFLNYFRSWKPGGKYVHFEASREKCYIYWSIECGLFDLLTFSRNRSILMLEKASNASFGNLMLGNKLHKSHALILHFFCLLGHLLFLLIHMQ